MGMNPMAGMFGGMNGMNGMNMGMNFNQNQGMFGFQNNMWQNSNNAFSNPMAGDFNYGFNYNQQQNYSNGDFQSGYYGRGFGRGRGRGRGRGGYGRGRGNFYQYQNDHPNFQNAHEQQQYEIQNLQNNSRQDRWKQKSIDQSKQDEPQPDDDEFAPGGQEDVQEALGDDYVKKEPKVEEGSTPVTPNGVVEQDAEMEAAQEVEATDSTHHQNNQLDTSVLSANVTEEPVPSSERKPIAEAYEEDLDMAMPPPSAPSGPSGKYGDRDYSFRARGHGRYSRSRGSIHLPNGHPPSPARSTSAQVLPLAESTGVGVVGAPTGPKAMREPAPKPTSRHSSSSGIQIIGRASMNASRATHRERSVSPSRFDEYGDPAPGRPSRREDSRYDDERDDYDRERRRHKSKREAREDNIMQDEVETYSRSASQDRRSAHKSRRDDKKYSSSLKHHSSYRRHRLGYEDEVQELDGYGELAEDG